ETQAKILARLYFALNDGGFLFLGKAETLLTHVNTFAPVDVKHRVFVKVLRASIRDRLLVLSQSNREDSVNQLVSHVRICERAFEADPVAQLVVDRSGYLILANERAREWFGIALRDVGRLFRDLDISFRPVELRSLI